MPTRSGASPATPRSWRAAPSSSSAPSRRSSASRACGSATPSPTPTLAPFLDVVQEPFNVNRAALAAGRACLAHPERIEERRRQSGEARALLAGLLADAGMESLPSEANFLLVHVGGDDTALASELVVRGYLVRPGSEFGLDGYVRITVGPPELMERVARELREVREAMSA